MSGMSQPRRGDESIKIVQHQLQPFSELCKEWHQLTRNRRRKLMSRMRGQHGRLFKFSATLHQTGTVSDGHCTKMVLYPRHLFTQIRSESNYVCLSHASQGIYDSVIEFQNPINSFD